MTTAPIDPPLLVIDGFGVGAPGQGGTGQLPLDPGTNKALAFGGVTGTMGLDLSAYLITGYSNGAGTNPNNQAAIPLAIVGVGGTKKFVALAGLIMGTIKANPYQLGMVTVMGGVNGAMSTLVATGFDNRTAGGLGGLQLVSPTLVSLGALGSLPRSRSSPSKSPSRLRSCSSDSVSPRSARCAAATHRGDAHSLPVAERAQALARTRTLQGEASCCSLRIRSGRLPDGSRRSDLRMARTRRALGALLAAWAASALPGCTSERSLAPAPPCAELELRGAPLRRSVVLVVNDTMRRDRVGAYGGPARTPAFDRFAAEGLLFEHAYSQAPWTKPSVATLFTGLYPSQHGVLSHPAGGGPAVESDALPRELTALAELLAAAGYETAAFVANPWLREELGFAQGFETWDDAAAANGAPGEPLVRAALGWLANRRDPRPFFLYLHTMDSHAPYPPIAEETLAARKTELAADDRPLREAAQVAIRNATRLEGGRSIAELGVPPSIALLGIAYDGGLAQFDAALAQLLAGLAERPDAGELAILVTSDHGEAFFEHGWASHGHGLFDDEIAVPLAAHLPGATGPARVGCPVGLVDVMATLCVYLGVDCPKDDFGVSFLPSPGAAREPRWIASEGVLRKPEHRSIRNGDVALLFEPRGRRVPAPGVRADAYELYSEGEEGELGERRPVPEELKRALASAVSKHAAPRTAGVPSTPRRAPGSRPSATPRSDGADPATPRATRVARRRRGGSGRAGTADPRASRSRRARTAPRSPSSRSRGAPRPPSIHQTQPDQQLQDPVDERMRHRQDDASAG